MAAAKGSQRVLEHPEFVSIKDMDTDGWKVASKVPQWLERGAVGIIPTDSQPALCCRLHDGEAVERLYRIKGMGAKKPLSIMCRDLRDVGLYTNGTSWPAGVTALLGVDVEEDAVRCCT